MAETFRLSVCITTRNRAAYLRQTLENVLRQCAQDVQVVVVDGASTDNSVAVVRELAGRHSQLNLVVAAKNSGLDADYDRAVAEASGEYCWLFSDDDFLAPGAIDRVLQACRDKPVAIIVDASVHTADFSEGVAERRLPSSGPTRYSAEQSQEFFRDCAKHLTFIGAVIVQRSFWLSRDRERYYGSEFIHCGVLFQAPLAGDVMVIREPLVQIRHGLGNWLRRWFEVWGVKWPRLNWSFDWIDPLIRRTINEPEPWADARYLLGSRAARKYGWPQFRDIVVPESDRAAKLVVPFLCAVVPWWFAYATIAIQVRLRSFIRTARSFALVDT
jgi:abequosyltransferase